MNVEEFRDYCLSLPHVTEKMPFGPDVLVFYIGGKIFALADINNYQFINVKCDPQKGLELREQYSEIQPGYHMNKKHWNSIYLNGRLTQQQIKNFLLDSYELVFAQLPKKVQTEMK